MKNSKTGSLVILASPLNWGLGHASRMIPIIRALQIKGHRIMLGGNGESLIMLQKEFPELKTITIPFPEIRYTHGKSHMRLFILGIFKFFFGTLRERVLLSRILKKTEIDLILSDNRLGLHSKRVKCILLTHQLRIQMPKRWEFLGYLTNVFNHYFIRKFDECWVPDADKEPFLSGLLSHPPLKENSIRYIGPVSRFNSKQEDNIQRKGILVILGGPEPQRSLLEKILIEQLSSSGYNATIAGGSFQSYGYNIPENIQYIPFAGSARLADLIRESEIIICRSGYSSVMDLVAMKRTAILIPTPGQPEQEYLAEFLSKKRYFLSCKQEGFDLQRTLLDWQGFEPVFPNMEFNRFQSILQD
jgi:uncharacterized protein (TIGR00661 family)